MSEVFDIRKFDKYKEDNRREVKTARDNLPVSLWDTYSSFANCYGGVIILGVKEREDGSWYTTGLKNPAKQQKTFWDMVNNRTKVSINLLTEKNVEIYEMNGDTIMVIYVPMARREQKPVYINDDLFGGTFRRDWEGDYHCTPLQGKAMIRDQTEDTYDMNVLPNTPMSDLNYDTVHSYRNRHQLLRPGHPFEGYSDEEYLRSIGAAAIAEEDDQLHPTGAGLSDPRNKALMKMFNMINVGERAGSGVPNILQTWSNEEWIEPVIDEQFNPDRTILKLSFIKKDSLGGESLTQRPTQATQGPTQGAKEIPTVYSLPEFDLAIISLMKKDPTISQTAMAASLNANINTLKYHVMKLREKGIIDREGSSQKGRWIVKL